MRAALVLAMLAAAPAAAQERVQWGAGVSVSSVTLAPADGPHIATVTHVNHLTGGGLTDRESVLSVGRFAVRVLTHDGPGDVPDTMTVIPPDGFLAVPPSLSTGEGESGVILIFETDSMPMG